MEPDNSAPSPSSKKELRRSIEDRKLFGVCAGLAKYFGLDSTIIRIVYVALTVASFGWGVLLYIIMVILMKEEEPFHE